MRNGQGGGYRKDRTKTQVLSSPCLLSLFVTLIMWNFKSVIAEVIYGGVCVNTLACTVSFTKKPGPIALLPY